jgi:Leucine-rich repeat (LRR) protein
LISLKSFGQETKDSEYQSIQVALANPIAVKSLDFSNQNLKSISTDITKLTNLEKVDISSNPNLDFAQAIEVLQQIEVA